MSKTKKIIELKINHMIFPCTGVGYHEEQAVYVKNAIEGQKVLVSLSKRKGRFFGRLISIMEKAPNQIEPQCETFDNCGGCVFQNISYQDELILKEKMLRNHFKLYEDKFKALIPAPTPLAYRNKMEFSFGDAEKGGELALGLRKQGTFYEVVIPTNCNIVSNDYLLILNTVLNFFRNTDETFYHKKNHSGSLRHLVIRSGSFSSEIFINLVTTDSLNVSLQPLTQLLIGLNLTSKIVGIVHTINNSLSDAVICEKMHTLFGVPYFHEDLMGLSFKIYPFSFFQSNSAGCQLLYAKVLDLIGDTKDKIVFDLFCGTGTITQIIAKNAKTVIGVEIVPESVEAAKENASRNNIDNCSFIADDVQNFVSTTTITPDYVVVDPPRQGLAPKAIKGIISLNPQSIVYVSCNPVTLLNDLHTFTQAGYSVEEMWAVDLFCRTGHVETVVLMSRVDK